MSDDDDPLPPPPPCIAAVLLDDNLLEVIFSALSPRDGGRACGTCQTWSTTWTVVWQGRALTCVQTVGPKLPRTEPGLPLHAQDEAWYGSATYLWLSGLRSLAALPNHEVLIGHFHNGFYHATPDFKVKRQITHHNDLPLGRVDHIECDADVVLCGATELEGISSRVMSFEVSDLSPKHMSAVDMYHGAMAIYADVVYVRAFGQIAELDKTSLLERSRFGDGVLGEGSLGAMAILGERLYVTDSPAEEGLPYSPTEEGLPCARVHIFSLQGEHVSTVDLAGIWGINWLLASHGRLYATEYVEPADVEDSVAWWRCRAVTGKRVLTLSPQLELLCEFRGEGEHARPVAFGAMAPRGDDELLVADMNNEAIHVLSV